ncbi:hypothetical protein [Stenotrophomonas sp.]|uniref:hypothetical protein n=1 Tax=Stenotrophomonas sp. TaxID=69392 RepID=UPI0028A06830|nr:hypothetical protein [Stenotrophomonas sp.]
MTIHWYDMLHATVWLMLAIMMSRPFAVILARRENQRSEAEEVLAKLPILASRSVEDLQDTSYACMLVIRAGYLRRPAVIASLVHMLLWGAMMLAMLCMAALMIVDYARGGF